jgi:hypothetical protein
MSDRRISRNLASVLLAGEWALERLVQRGAKACGKRHRWLRPLVKRVLGAFPRPPAERALADFLLADEGLARAGAGCACLLDLVCLGPPPMTPAPGGPSSWRVPALTSPAGLAAWLGVSPGELSWFADCQRRLRFAHGRDGRATGRLRHYTCFWRTSPGKARLLEVPKPRLKTLQRKLLDDLLAHVPTHDAAHGYCKGRSLRTFVGPHLRRRIVLRMDLRHFFPSVSAARVRALFRTAGYPEQVARLLAGLCTTAAPPDVLDAMPEVGDRGRREEARALLACPHLPQGAPTSPALANLCAWRLDVRLAGLAQSAGAAYTRYADDLVFSGDEGLERAARRFHVGVCVIALEEGFEVNTRKTRFLRRGVRQSAAGVVLNEVPNVRRSEYDELKAILTNCVRRGPEGENREGHPDFRAHLLGRIAHVGMLNPGRGAKLQALFGRIEWAGPPRDRGVHPPDKTPEEEKQEPTSPHW